MAVNPSFPVEGGLRLAGKFHKKPSPEKPLFSIITVVFNGEPSLEKTIDSVTNQTYDNIEYIIIDGNSRDKTLDVIKKHENKITYWKSEPDKGIYDGMNKGLDAATGDYLLFLNSGDLIAERDTFEKIVSNLNYQDIIFSETYMIDSNGKILGTRSELTTRKLPEVLSWKDFTKGMLVCHQSFIVKKKHCTHLQYQLPLQR